jgi:hypothetical protein
MVVVRSCKKLATQGALSASKSPLLEVVDESRV